MSMQLRLPNINAGTTDGQMAQMRSYLYQMVEQLNWALGTGISQAVSSQNLQAVVAAAAGQAGAKADPAETFTSIKSLIIKSADIVNAYYEEINHRLEGEYVAQSEYGTFVEQTEANFEANSKSVELNFANMQLVQEQQSVDLEKMASDLAAIQSAALETNAYLRSGLLDEDADGIPIYGLEVGQRNEVDGVEVFNKFARFTANRLEFYDAGNQEDPVAYISDYKLFITNAQITGTLTLGGYELDTSNGLAFKWIGGM